MINLAGESSISRSRIEEHMNEMGFSLEEMDGTVDRLHAQLRRLEIETEAQIVFRQEQVGVEGIENFDPLEMDRYSAMQQLSKSLIEATSDLDDISATITNKMRDMETILLQQSRINTELQEGLMRAQMVPFSRMVPRLRRIVRQVAGELGKKIDFQVENAEGELDRTILERMIAPLEHMLRNAVDHGVEMPDKRKAAGKNETGTINLSLSREGGEVVLTLRDDGAGVNLEAVRKKAIERGLMKEDQRLSDNEIAQFILHAGFSTAEKVTQISGRGVGMDVVHSEIKQLGGAVNIDSKAGEGTTFHVHLPFTVSVNRALMVSIGHDTYAIPLNTIEGIVRVSPYELEAYYQPDAPLFEYAGQGYELKYMGSLLQHGHQAKLDGLSMPLPVILIRSADYSVAVQVDQLFGSQEVVVKSLGPQFSMVDGVSGATVLGNGKVVVILDMLSLIRADASRALLDDGDRATSIEAVKEEKATTVMVVDDSVTVRKVTSRLLDRYGFEVILAKDGQDAVTQLQDMNTMPDIMLLDIEMPRMDGFEVLSRVRHNNVMQDIPVVMITSRTGEKHRERAMSLGASRYLGKPFQERELLQTIGELTGNHVLEA
jgi:chemosensory pili system protein ChpA (sensor histidine kinase/response regulator)